MSIFEASSDFKVYAKPYTRKEPVRIETSIVDFNQRFYIYVINNLIFQSPHVNICVTNNYGNISLETFKSRASEQDAKLVMIL